MKTLRIVALALAGLLAACAWHFDPDKHAREFFNDGRDAILSALKKQDATDAQLQQARAIIGNREQTVPQEIGAVLRKQQALFRAVTSGQTSERLTALEADLHKANEQAVRSIGRMHEELAAAVGDKTWKAAMSSLDQRMARHFRD